MTIYFHCLLLRESELTMGQWVNNCGWVGSVSVTCWPMIKLTKFRSTSPLSRETFAQMTSAGCTTNDLQSFKRMFSRDNLVADERRVSGLFIYFFISLMFFQWRRSAVCTDWQQVWFNRLNFPKQCVHAVCEILIFITLFVCYFVDLLVTDVTTAKAIYHCTHPVSHVIF